MPKSKVKISVTNPTQTANLTVPLVQTKVVNFLDGTTPPNDLDGKNGDFYLNKTAKLLYKKENGTWY